MGRLGSAIAIAGFLAAPMVLTGCDDTATSSRTTKTTTETPTQKTTQKSTDEIKTTDKNP